MRRVVHVGLYTSRALRGSVNTALPWHLLGAALFRNAAGTSITIMLKVMLVLGLPIVLGTLMPSVAHAAAPSRNAEVQINLCSEPDTVVRALHLEPAGAAFEAWYFETADLALFRQGVLFRLRVRAHGAQLTLKVANQECSDIAPALLPAREAKCEYDVHGDHVAGAVSITTNLDDAHVRTLSAKPDALPDLLSRAQIDYLRNLGVWPLAVALERVGPVHIQAFRHKGEAFVVEAWQLPTGQQYLEISQKTTRADAPHVHERLMARLGRSGVEVCADQGSQAGAKLRELFGVN